MRRLRVSIVALLSFLFLVGDGAAQDSDQKLYDNARKEFKRKFEAEYGQLPSAEVVDRAMAEWQNFVVTIAGQLGKRAGKVAVRNDKVKEFIAAGKGLEFIRLLSQASSPSIKNTGLKKSDVVGLAGKLKSRHVLSGKTLIRNADKIGKLEPDTKIEFPEGYFEIDKETIGSMLVASGKKFPNGIAFSGKGKSKTTLKIRGLHQIIDDVDRLTFEGMTIDCDHDGLFDKNHGALTLNLTDVRFVRFASPSCTLFSVKDGLIVHAVGCDFLGYVGQWPTQGRLFGDGEVLVGHFENCLFTGFKNDLVLPAVTQLWMDKCQFGEQWVGIADVEFEDCEVGRFQVSMPWVPPEAKELARLVKDGSGSEFIARLKRMQRSMGRSSLISGVEKSSVGVFAKPVLAAKQFDGEKLANDPGKIVNIDDNSEIVFSKGAFEINVREMEIALRQKSKPFPNGVTFLGQGKGLTTLKVSDAGFTIGDVDKLAFRDMTIDCDNDSMLDKRRGSLTLAFSKVRLVRFDAGHGGCKLFRVNDGIVVHATDTEFLGGFGRSPGNGKIFARKDLLLGHFERCSFFGINSDFFKDLRGRSERVWMDDCQFDRTYEPNERVELNDCKFDVKPPAVDWAPTENQ